MSDNRNLHSANKAKQDEFYTQLSDIENELKHYKKHFKGKTVLCNCDDPRVSNFFHYFAYNFEHLGLKRLITTCYKNQERDLFSQNNSERAIWLEYFGDKNGNLVPDPEEIGIHYFEGNGDFRSKECIELLKQADIVVTNPPFSLFREYVAQLMEYKKKFLIIGNQNAFTYKDIFKLIKENNLWTGYHVGHTLFGVPSSYTIPDFYDKNDKSKLRSNGYVIDENGKLWRNLGNICWFTNLDIPKRHEKIILYKKYNVDEYPQYDNYEAINCNKVEDVPENFDGVMGVPITFLNKYNPDQFEILGMESSAGYDPEIVGIPRLKDGDARPAINGKTTYARIFIRRRKEA